MENTDMFVTKRQGKLEILSFDKILNRIKQIGKDNNLNINYSHIVIKIIEQLYDKISTYKIDVLIAEHCISLSCLNLEYGILASKILLSNHQKSTDKSFHKTMKKLYNCKDIQDKHTPIITKEFWTIVNNHKEIFDNMIVHSRDNMLDYFGFKTLEHSYLLKLNNVVVETPQHMWLRVAICIHGCNIELVKETYDLMSCKYFTHATPTLYNSGTHTANLSSCFLVAMEEDSLEGIFNTLQDCAKISKHSGGIGLHIHNIRSAGSNIKRINGKSGGIVPMLRVFNNTARYINQGGKRNGSYAVYVEPWHADIEGFLEMKTNHGDEDLKGRDLFYALWVPDLFMERVESNSKWSLFCPDRCPGLSDVYGEKFKELYEKYENDGLANYTIKARDLWYKVLDSQMETGTPYLLFKDSINKKSNQKNLGTIKSSNLCTEITLYTDNKETAVCNLASIGLPSFVNKDSMTFDYEKLHYVTKVVTQNLNNVIDINFYPTEKAKSSNMKHRPIGIGVQGLSDTFFLLNIAFHSNEAKELNKNIFETMYHASLEKSNELAVLKGSYSSFKGSPASNGILQFDLWGESPSNRYDWATLKKNIIENGLYNSMLLAPMPTASTSQILGFNECFEPITSNIYSRGTLVGEFVVVNKYLMKELNDMGKWDEKIKNNIIANNGSIQQLEFLPQFIRDKYKTVWEIPMKHIIDMAAERGAYICQSQSMNLWVEDPNYKSLTSMHFYSYKKGLKTGIYYLRRKASSEAQKFTIEPENNYKEEDEVCEFCSS
jgi:ribonucleoside-diphosphate reductase alpha chain